MTVSWPPRAGSEPVQIVKMTMVHIMHGIVSMPSSSNKGSKICSSGTLRDCRDASTWCFVFRQVPIQQIDQSYSLQCRRSFLPFFHSSCSASKCVLVLSHHQFPAQLCLTLFCTLQDSCRPGNLTNCCADVAQNEVASIMKIPRSILCATALETLDGGASLYSMSHLEPRHHLGCGRSLSCVLRCLRHLASSTPSFPG